MKYSTIVALLAAFTQVTQANWTLDFKRTVTKNLNKDEKIDNKCQDIEGTYYKDEECT